MSTPAPNLKATLQAEESKFWTFLKTNWAHFVTWIGVAYSIYKHL